MPTRPWSVRAAVSALGLSSLLLASSSSGAFAHVHEVEEAAGVAEPSGRAGPSVAEPSGPTVSEGTPGSAVVERIVCAAGFDDVHSKPDMSLHGVTLTSDGALAVGFTRRRGPNVDAKRRPAAIYNPSDSWTRVLPGSPGKEDGLVAVTAGRRAEAWAVGFTTIGGRVMPLAMRWNGKRWRVNRPQPRGSMPAMFTDVVLLGGGDPFAVGYRMTGDGKRLPVAARKAGTRWLYVNPQVGRHESVSLTGVASDDRDGLWVVGHGGPGAEIGPVIYRRADARWKRMKVPRLPGEAVLADVVATAPNDAWAVGYQRDRSGSQPLVLRWDGKRWQRAVTPSFESEDVVLTAASVASGGGIWVVGAAWDAEARSHQAVAAWWDGQAWNEVAGRRGGTELHDVAGSLDGDGWAVGRAGRSARTTRVCTPPQAGIFGGSEPYEPEVPRPPAGDLAAATITRSEPAAERDASAGGDAAQAAVTTAEADAEHDAEVADQAAAARRVVTRKNKAARKRAAQARQKRRSPLKALPRPKVSQRLIARDVAGQAGIAESTNTYGAVVADFDGDGLDDVFIGRHGRSGRLALNQGGTFVDHEGVFFPAVDRHGCAAADIDGSGLPDLYCSVGGKRGSGLKSNELWIDPAGPDPTESAVPDGVADPLGRGRHAVFLETDDGDDTKLVVTNSPTRVDGLPSVGRLFRVDGEHRFVGRSRTGFASRLGSLTVSKGDFDGDGREDLLLVTGGPQAPRAVGTHLYRNTRRGLVDVTRQMGIRSIGEVDAELVDLNGDRKLDLVQLSPTRLRVSILRNGRYEPVYERRLTHGRAIAGGDVNGDGRDDLYIMRSNGQHNSPDIMLVNGGAGRTWTSMVIPQARSGDGDDVVAIDHDGNGLHGFLVLNGRNRRGPIQLIAFYPR